MENDQFHCNYRPTIFPGNPSVSTNSSGQNKGKCLSGYYILPDRRRPTTDDDHDEAMMMYHQPTTVEQSSEVLLVGRSVGPEIRRLVSPCGKTMELMMENFSYPSASSPRRCDALLEQSRFFHPGSKWHHYRQEAFVLFSAPWSGGMLQPAGWLISYIGKFSSMTGQMRKWYLST